MDEYRRYRVFGLVQGVGFRYYTQRQATGLGLTGWVRNCADGTVELVVVGGNAQHRELKRWLEEGPGIAQVSHVEVETVSESEIYTGFSIR